MINLIISQLDMDKNECRDDSNLQTTVLAPSVYLYALRHVHYIIVPGVY